MVVGALNSKNRIFHYPNCIYAKRIKDENLIRFDTKDEARACGYRHCIYCSRLIKYYIQDQKKIDKFLRDNHLKMYIDDDSMYIDNDYSCWKITIIPNGYELILYHGNTEAYNKLKIKDGHIQHHYHLQKYRGKLEILAMLEYIIDHDKWKAEHMDSYKDLPRRTKKQRKEYNKQAKHAKRIKMNNLYNMLYKVSLEEKKLKQK